MQVMATLQGFYSRLQPHKSEQPLGAVSGDRFFASLRTSRDPPRGELRRSGEEASGSTWRVGWVPSPERRRALLDRERAHGRPLAILSLPGEPARGAGAV